MSLIIFNQQILRKEEFQISIANRAFLYGDGLFESVKIINGKPFNLDVHLKRLFSAALLLHLEINVSRNDFQDDIELLIRENKIKKGGNLKILVFREEGGKYLPENNQASSLIMSETSDKNSFSLNKKGLELGLFKTQLKPMNKLSNYKTISALQSVMCSLDARQKAKDDCLMFNTENRIIESANSNIFYVKNNIIFTPQLREGCVDGTMRNCILNLKDLDYKIVENEVKIGDILEAEEVFLTNAIQGVRWVSHVKEQQFTEEKVAKLLTKKINQLV